MIRRPTRSTRIDPRFPCTWLFRSDSHITVVLGPTAPWRDRVRAITETMPWPTRLIIGAQDMAALIAEADVAIGAAGSSAWERCCLGLPTILWVLAANQPVVADPLVAADASSEERRVGKAWVSKCDSRCAPATTKKK